jgi:hypothetical protein
MPPFYTVAYEGVMAVRPAGNQVFVADQDFKAPDRRQDESAERQRPRPVRHRSVHRRP